ncbi:hypothetical protein AMTR_s00022p00097040 [Amborella trichopoda]|uniref:Glycoside hydrolase family 19 catalytic domain-containing protein n=1 Tax=Amborella trichopoda TaxID=13333 RepID=W1PW01_AMBTC|nr:hypothetical protein AMTR_s00022p00097040 [Amborella trichopoda]
MGMKWMLVLVTLGLLLGLSSGAKKKTCDKGWECKGSIYCCNDTISDFFQAYQFENLFSKRNAPVAHAVGFWDYKSFILASTQYQPLGFGTSGGKKMQMKEVSAFLSHVGSKTSFFCKRLCFPHDGICTARGPPLPVCSLRLHLSLTEVQRPICNQTASLILLYSFENLQGLEWGRNVWVQCGDRRSICLGPLYNHEMSPSQSYCDPNYLYPCAPGVDYYGRGAIPVYWNYNYGRIGDALKVDILNHPEYLEQNATLAFMAAMHEWMTPKKKNQPSAHDAYVGNWKPTKNDTLSKRLPGLGITMNILYGDQVCGQGSVDSMNNIVSHNLYYLDLMGVGQQYSGENLDCAEQVPFNPSVKSATS